MVLQEVMSHPYLQNAWLQAALIVVFFYFIAHFCAFILKHFVKKITVRTKTEIDDKIIEKSYSPVVYSLVVVGLKIALTRLTLSERVYSTIQHVFNSLLAILLVYLAYAVAKIVLDAWGHAFAKRTKSTLDDDLLPLLHKAVKITFFVLSIFFILSEWEVDITGLLAGVGIAGLAIGFAVKDSLANIFGGISLILDKAFKVGDVIKLPDGDMGTVMDIGLRSTRIKNWDNELLIVPNGELANAKIQNFKQPDESVRVVIEFGVEYGSDVEKVKKVVINCLKKLPNVMEETGKEPAVHFMAMGESSLNFRTTFWVKTFGERFSTKEKATTLIYQTLNKSKIGIPFPTRTVYLHKEK